MEDIPRLARRRVLPPLAAQDSELGSIRWEPWQDALQVSHIDSSCQACSFPGPLATAHGLTLYSPPASVLTTRRADRAGPPPTAARGTPYWVVSHWASRCPQCDETWVHRMNGWVEVQHQWPTIERTLPPADGVLF